jgi:hypothetical protein
MQDKIMMKNFLIPLKMVKKKTYAKVENPNSNLVLYKEKKDNKSNNSVKTKKSKKSKK